MFTQILQNCLLKTNYSFVNLTMNVQYNTSCDDIKEKHTKLQVRRGPVLSDNETLIVEG